MAATTLAFVVFGLWPAIQSTRTDVRSGLGAGVGATTPKWRVHRTIIAWQVCGSVALLLVALLSVRVISATATAQAAATSHGDLSLAQVNFALNGRDEAHMRALTASIVETMRARGSAHAVAAANGLPFGWLTVYNAERSRVGTAMAPGDDASAGPMPAIIATTPAFFTATGIDVLRGRAFEDQDEADAVPVAIVNQQAARELFQTENAVGRTIYLPSLTAAESVATTVIGVCRNDHVWLSSRRPDSDVFVPFSQRYVRSASITFIARSPAPALAAAELKSSIRTVDPDLAISVAGTGAVLLDGPLVIVRTIVAMTATLGTLALVLSMVGLFGVLSHLVSKRTREIGIRLAMGAERRDVFRLVLRDGLRPVLKGLVLGLGIGVGARIAVKAWVATDVAAVDPLPLLLLPIPFAVAACIASYIPARRASRVDPNVALREL
jgi:putative ABC transport system permease protein